MANNNNNKAPVNTKPQGFKTRKGASNKAVASPDEKRVRTPEEIKRRNGIIITVVAAVLIVAAVAGLCAVIISAIIKGGKVDYLKDDLSKYINISKEDYTGIEIDVPLVEYSDAMLTAEINKLIVKNKSEKAEHDGYGITSAPIALGDVISFIYRVYTVDENGKQTEIPGYCNFNDDNKATLEIGSQNGWFLGFEESLLGVVPQDNDNFKKINAGTVTADDVIYLSYTAYYPTGAATSASYERIDLSRDDIDSTYGEGFKNFMFGSQIGEKLDVATFKTADGSIGYSDMKIEFATKCEKNCLTYDVTFPADHNDGTEEGIALRGVKAKIDIYIDSAVKYKTPEYNSEFITGTLGVSEDALSSYSGEDTVAKHKEYLKASILKDVERTNEMLISEAIWKVISAKGEVIKYPEDKYNELYNAYNANVESYYNQYAESQGFPSIDSAAISYFGLSSGADWQAHIKGLVEKKVKEDLILYYIIRKEGFLPTDAEYEAEYNLLLSEYVDYYLGVHADEFKNFEGAEYDEQLKILTDEIKGVYGTQIDYDVYINTLLRKMQNNPEFVTVK